MGAHTINLTQSSPEWHAWRRAGAPASYAPAIMGEDKFGRTPQTVYRAIKGELEERDTPAMQRGRDYEPVAVAAYEAELRLIMQPTCMEWEKWPILRASLDGRTFDGACILEVKCAGKDDHATAMAGQVPRHYYAQVQQQLLVSGARVCHYWSFDLNRMKGVLAEVYPDSDYIAKLVQAWRDFWVYVEKGEPPPLTAKDVVQRTDEGFLTLATEYRRCEAAAVEWAAKRDATREALIEQMGDAERVTGGGVSLSRYWREGNIKYADVPELKGVDLEPFRAAGRRQVRVSLSKEEGR